MKSLPYQTPQNPGYIGGFSWKPTVSAFCIFALANFIATQYVAYRFNFQAALGVPLVRAERMAIYEPFHWAVWALRYSGSGNPDISRIVLAGAGISLLGTMLAVAAYLAFAMQRNRRLSKGNEDLHGSARWANMEEIREAGILDCSQGVYIGGWYNERKKYLHYLRHNGPEHVLAFAPTRSGKGVGLVIPTLLAWDESALVYDIKGENWAKTSGMRESMGQVCFKFSPVEQGVSARFNPLAEVRVCTPRDVADAQNLAEMLVRTGQDTPTDRYWQDAAASIMTGMVLHACYAASLENRPPTFSELAGVFTRPGQGFRDTLAEVINFSHDERHLQGWRTPEGAPTQTHPVVREKAQEMLDKEDKDFSGVLSTAKTALALFSDPLVIQNTATSDFRIADLVQSDKPVSLYIVVPPSDKVRLRPLVRLIFTMVVNRLTEKLDFQGASQIKPKHRLLFLIDEFPSLGRMEVFADALSYMAGYGLKAYLISQDIRQIVDQYGANEGIVSNCHVRIAYAPNQYETAELLSKMTGNKTIQKASFNYSGRRFSPMMEHLNAAIDQVERPLLTPDEVMRLKSAHKSGSGDDERIDYPGDMLIFQAGRRPIYGTQILYFNDPVLSKRAQMPPPAASYQIREGNVVPRAPGQGSPAGSSKNGSNPDFATTAQAVASGASTAGPGSA